jgi:hypothetical protein
MIDLTEFMSVEEYLELIWNDPKKRRELVKAQHRINAKLRDGIAELEEARDNACNDRDMWRSKCEELEAQNKLLRGEYTAWVITLYEEWLAFKEQADD